jgi:hypothetical protein
MLLVINFKRRGRFHVDGASMVTEQSRDSILCVVMPVNVLEYVVLHAQDPCSATANDWVWGATDAAGDGGQQHQSSDLFGLVKDRW